MDFEDLESGPPLTTLPLLVAATLFAFAAYLAAGIWQEAALENRVGARAHGSPASAAGPSLPQRVVARVFRLEKAPGMEQLGIAAGSGAVFAWYLGADSASMALGACGGLVMYPLILRERLEARRREAAAQVPIFLDLLALSVRAGSSLDLALQSAHPYLPPGLLSAELAKSMGEMRVGLPRAEALKGLAARLKIPALNGAVAAMRQAESLGSPIASTLASQARAARAERLHLLEGEAQKVPVKLLLPLMIFIFPVTLALVLGPVGLRLMGVYP